MQEAAQELEDLDLLERGRLVLCTSDTTGCYRLPAILKPFQDRYPGIDIVVKNATSLRTIQAVVNNEVDLGIVTLAYLTPDIESIPLFSRDDVLITHPAHPLARRRTVHLKDLENYPMILLDQHCASRRIIDELCVKARVNLDITMELSSIEVIKHFVRIDAGLSIVPAIAIQEEIENGVLAQVKISDFQGRPRQRMGPIYKKGRYLSRAAQRFLEAMQGKEMKG
jgi:DNA-binding transcriptional LysR family regulator